MLKNTIINCVVGFIVGFSAIGIEDDGVQSKQPERQTHELILSSCDDRKINRFKLEIAPLEAVCRVELVVIDHDGQFAGGSKLANSCGCVSGTIATDFDDGEGDKLRAKLNLEAGVAANSCVTRYVQIQVLTKDGHRRVINAVVDIIRGSPIQGPETVELSEGTGTVTVKNLGSNAWLAVEVRSDWDGTAQCEHLTSTEDDGQSATFCLCASDYFDEFRTLQLRASLADGSTAVRTLKVRNRKNLKFAWQVPSSPVRVDTETQFSFFVVAKKNFKDREEFPSANVRSLDAPGSSHATIEQVFARESHAAYRVKFTPESYGEIVVDLEFEGYPESTARVTANVQQP